jgi:hypothetical protein
MSVSRFNINVEERSDGRFREFFKEEEFRLRNRTSYSENHRILLEKKRKSNYDYDKEVYTLIYLHIYI